MTEQYKNHLLSHPGPSVKQRQMSTLSRSVAFHLLIVLTSEDYLWWARSWSTARTGYTFQLLLLVQVRLFLCLKFDQMWVNCSKQKEWKATLFLPESKFNWPRVKFTGNHIHWGHNKIQRFFLCLEWIWLRWHFSAWSLRELKSLSAC